MTRQAAVGTKKAKKRFLKWLPLFILLLPVLLWTAGSLFFGSAVGRGLVAARCQAKLGLPCRIDRLTWLPWENPRLQGLEILAPGGGNAAQPLLKLDRVEVVPRWDSLWRKKLDFSDLELSGVYLNLSLETLQALSAQRLQPPPAPAVPETKEAPPAPEPNEETVAPQKKPAHRPPPQKSPPQPAPASQKAEKPLVTHRIHLKDLNVRLFSEKSPAGESLLLLQGLSGEIPLGGDETSALAIDSLQIMGHEITDLREIPLHCVGRGVGSRFPLRIIGVETQCQLALQLSALLPVELSLVCPPQELAFKDLPKGLPPLAISKFEQQHVFRGLLTRPTSWQGTSMGAYADVHFDDPEDGSDVAFLHGRHLAVLRGGSLQLSDFRLIGEEDSVLGNALLSSAGRLDAVLRLVSTPERARAHHHRVKGMARLRQKDFQLTFEPLGVPERYYHD
ncbi:MAG: AsmA family protein, partial [Verrucomicrobiales bacterium]